MRILIDADGCPGVPEDRKRGFFFGKNGFFYLILSIVYALL